MGIYEVLEENLLSDYGKNEPIVTKQIDSKAEYGLDKKTFLKYLSVLNEDEKIARYQNGIYYFPEQSQYFDDYLAISDDKVIERKYLSLKSGSDIFGYKTGHSFANYLNLSSQVPQVIEIVTNNVSKTLVENLNSKYIIKKTRVTINKKNYRLLQVLDLITDYWGIIETSTEKVKNTIEDYLSETKISANEFKNIIASYPPKTAKALFLYDLDSIVRKTTV